MRWTAPSADAWTPFGPPPRRAAPRPHPPRPRAGRPDRRVLGEPGDADLRRAADRRRGGPDSPGCTGRDATRVRPLTRRGASALEGRRPIIDLATGDDYWPFGQRVWPNGLSPATPPIRTLWGTNSIPQKGALSRGGSAREHSLPSVPDRVRRRRGRLHLPHGPRGAGRSLPHGRRAGRVAVALPDGHEKGPLRGRRARCGLRSWTWRRRT